MPLHQKVYEINRAVWHCLSVLAVALLFYSANRFGSLILLLIGITFVSLDYLRSQEVTFVNKYILPNWMNEFIRVSEQKKLSNSSYYAVAGMVIIVLQLMTDFPREIGVVASIFLAFGDPMARIVGKATISPKWYKEKTRNGTLAFFVTASISALVFSVATGGIISPILIVFTAGIGAFMELFSGEYDNFSVPFVCTFILYGGYEMIN